MSAERVPTRLVVLSAPLTFQVQLAVLHVDGVDRVEGLEDFFVRAQAERAQEDGSQELALAIDADVEDVLLVVLELHPRTAVRNDLAEEVGAVVRRLKEDAGRAVQLRNDNALGAVDDEGAVRRHQRDVAEEDFLLLHVAQALDAGLGVLVVNLQADGDLQRSRVGHAALFALCLVVLQLQADGIAALGAEVRRVLVVRSAEFAEHVARVEGVGDDHVAAVGAGRAQVVEALEVAALALPVADGEVDKLELGDVAEVGDGEHGGEDGLEAVVLALLGELVHLEEALIAAALDLDEVGDLDAGRDFREIETAADSAHCDVRVAVVRIRHALSCCVTRGLCEMPVSGRISAGEWPGCGLLRWTSFAPFRHRRSSRRCCLSAVCYSPRSILRGPENLWLLQVILESTSEAAKNAVLHQVQTEVAPDESYVVLGNSESARGDRASRERR